MPKCQAVKGTNGINNLTACGGGGGGASCDTPLTTSYVDTELTTEIIFTSDVITPSNTKLIHEDGNQGEMYDIDRVMLTSITAPDVPTGTRETLAVSYSVHATEGAPPDSYMALYIDIDGDVDSGYLPGLIGADALILDSVGDSTGAGILDAYYYWTGTSWSAGTKYDFRSSTASYFAGCTLGLAIFVPWYTEIASLDLTAGANVSGVMMLQIFHNDDPNDPMPITVNATDVFSFSFP